MNLNHKALEAKEVCFSYPDGTAALKGINISIPKGEFAGVLGGNGSGKTTLLRLLNGLLKPAKGDILIEGKNIKSINRDALFTKVCTMFQNPEDQLFSPTVAQDIAFGPVNMGLSREAVRQRVESALEAVEMSDYAQRPIHALSFGQKKRVCLAGVLAMDPEIILLDEPTSCLDPAGVSSIMRLLKDLNKQKGITFVMSTHSVDLVPVFIDRVIVLDKGVVVQDGAPQAVFSDSDKLKEAKLRLPHIGHLFEVLKNEDGHNIKHLPLTVGEARQELKRLWS
jgi:cobalt transport protein ATP-binding subunit